MRDYEVVDYSSAYCKKCGILLCDFLYKNNNNSYFNDEQ